MPEPVCVCLTQLEDENKGWEGIWYFEEGEERHLLGLCESGCRPKSLEAGLPGNDSLPHLLYLHAVHLCAGNYCKTVTGPSKPGRDRGHGRLIWTKHVKGEDGSCGWEVLKVISIPEDVAFLDFAGIAFWPPNKGSRVAIVSQVSEGLSLGDPQGARGTLLPASPRSLPPSPSCSHAPAGGCAAGRCCRVGGPFQLGGHGVQGRRHHPPLPT